MANGLSRKQLEAMGLEEKICDAIIEAYLPTANELKQARTDLEALRAENDTLKKGAGDFATEKARADKAVKDLEDYKALVTKREKTAKVENAYRALARSAKIDEKRLDTVVKWARINNVLDNEALKEDGTLEHADKLLEGIQTEFADFVTDSNTRGSGPSTPPGGSKTEADDLAAVRAAMGLPPQNGGK